MGWEEITVLSHLKANIVSVRISTLKIPTGCLYRLVSHDH